MDTDLFCKICYKTEKKDTFTLFSINSTKKGQKEQNGSKRSVAKIIHFFYLNNHKIGQNSQIWANFEKNVA